MSKQSETRRIAADSQSMHWTQTQFVNFMSTTDSYIGKDESKQIFKDEKIRYRNDRRLERSGKRTIDYNDLNVAHTDILSKYSIRVRYYVQDSNGEYQKDANGNRRTEYMTVRSNRKLSRQQIYKEADRKSKRGRYPDKHVGFKIVGGLRRV